jgi:WD40 repeat protein
MEALEFPVARYLGSGTKPNFASSISFHPHLPVLAYATSKNTQSVNVSFINLESGKEIGNIHISQQINCIAFHPSSNIMLTGDIKSNVIIWEVHIEPHGEASSRQLTSLSEHTGVITCLAFHSTLPFFASGGNDKTMKLWRYTNKDWTKTECVATLTAHTHSITSLAFHPVRSFVATTSKDNTAKIWDFSVIDNVNCITTCKGEPGGGSLKCVAFHPNPDKSILATGGENDKSIILWDYSAIEEPRRIVVLKGHTNPINSIVFHPTAPLLISGSMDYTTKMWFIPENEEDTRLIETLSPQMEAELAMVSSIAIYPHTDSLLAVLRSSVNHTITLYDLDDIIKVSKKQNSHYLKKTRHVYNGIFNELGIPETKKIPRPSKKSPSKKSPSKKSPSKKSPSKKSPSPIKKPNPGGGGKTRINRRNRNRNNYTRKK